MNFVIKNISVLILLTISAFTFSQESLNNEKECQYEIKNALKRGGFSGILDSQASIKLIGQYKNEKIQRDVYVYEREFGNQRLTRRLIIISNGNYDGMYELFDQPPKIQDGIMVFPYSNDDGNIISLKDKSLPNKALIDGELVELFK